MDAVLVDTDVTTTTMGNLKHEICKVGSFEKCLNEKNAWRELTLKMEKQCSQERKGCQDNKSAKFSHQCKDILAYFQFKK